jgi:hypothetical protein
MRDKKLQEAIFNEVKLPNRVIMDKSEPLDSVPESQRLLQYERLVEELSAFYLRQPGLLKTGPTGEKHYDFNCIDLAALEKEVERILAVICAPTSPVTGNQSTGRRRAASKTALLEIRDKVRAPARTADIRARAYRPRPIR